jgi:hypothetical protein
VEETIMLAANLNPARIAVFVGVLAVVLLTATPAAYGHCDTMNGPVVSDAKTAIENGDVAPVLKWVSPDHETEIRGAFEKTLVVREGGPEARELADKYFFETLVRIHRAGEGAPYTGLKSTPVEPIIAEADKAFEVGSADALAEQLAGSVKAAVHERFQRALEAKKHAGESVGAGREYVKAYVQYTHFVEGLHNAIGEGAEAHHVTGGLEH